MNINIKLATVPLIAIVFFSSSCDSKSKQGSESKDKKTVQHFLPIDTALQRRVKDFAQRPRPQGAFGFYVYDFTAQKPVGGFQENVAQPSASCLKLLTGVAGLKLFSTQHQYYTSIYMNGRVVADTLKGNLFFKAGLDPQLQEPELLQFAQAIRKRGVKSVKGKMVLDVVLKEPVRSELHWYPWDLSFSHYSLLFKGPDKLKRAIKSSFRQEGIALADSQLVVGKLAKDSRPVFVYKRSIHDVLKRMWKNSSNTQATSLLYAIGHRVNPTGDPAQSGVAYLRAFLADSIGVKDKNLVIHDGCGLCVHNHLTPKALVKILCYGLMNPDIANEMQRSLAIAGVDGTLRVELSDPNLRGKVHAKTGTLSHPYGISSLAGYTIGANGHLLVFSIMDHQMSVLDARVLQRKLCKELVKE